MKKLVLRTVAMAAAVFIGATVLLGIARAPSLKEVRAGYRSDDKLVLDRNRLAIDEIKAEPGRRRLAWMELEQMPEAVIKAVDAAGINLTLQVARWLDRQPKEGAAGLLQNLGEAAVLKMKWSNSAIVEAFLNLAYYRADLQGVAGVSYALFDKPPVRLSRAEAAVLVALAETPSATVDQARRRACVILRRMGHGLECGRLSESHLTYLEKAYRLRPFVRMAPHVAARLAAAPEMRDADLIRSTLDRPLQWTAIHSLQKQLAEHPATAGGAAVVIENNTGYVLAYVGNTGSSAKTPGADLAMVPHAAGPMLHPLIYGKAIDERILTAASIWEDSPLALNPGRGGDVRRRLVTVRKAVAAGFKIPALRTLELLGLEDFVRTMADFGFGGLARPDHYGPSLALGSAEIRLLDLTNAYRTLVNGGVWSPVSFSVEVPGDAAARRVMSAEAAFIIQDILAEASATTYWSAVIGGSDGKGSSEWAVGFSERYTIGVWTGGMGAAGAFRAILGALHGKETSDPPRPPEGLVQAEIRFNGVSRREWFLSGTEPGNPFMESISGLKSRFSYPLDRSTVAVTGGSAKKSQRLFIQVVAPKADQHIYLNGRRLGRAKPLWPWDPRSGSHRLELRDSKGLVLDRVRFEVLGPAYSSAM